MEYNNCLTDLKAAFNNTNGTFISPYKDATGKIGSGILEGNLVWLGNFDQCEGLHDGKYCLLDITTNLPGENITFDKEEQKVALIRWGLCAVSSCNATSIKQNLQLIVNETQGPSWVNVSEVEVNCSKDAYFSAGFFATISLTLLLLVLCLLGTAAEIFVKHKRNNMGKLVHNIDETEPHLTPPAGSISREDATSTQASHSGNLVDLAAIRQSVLLKPGKFLKFLICFSVPQNLKLLFNTQHTDKSVLCLNGIRFLSIAWIVLGHTFLATFSSNIIVNPKAAKEYAKRISWQPVGNAYFGVDTFFFLSGLLVTFIALNEMQKRDGKIPLLYYYVHRYLRLTPSMAFSLLIWIYVKPYLGSGPLWYQMQSDPLCAQYWWPNLLYIQNFYPTQLDLVCIGWTWYLSLDMQFYVIAPVCFIPLYRNMKVGIILIGCLASASLIVTAVLIGIYGIDVNLTFSVLNMDTSAMMDYETIIYGKPYCRISTYLTGMVVGYILFKVPKSSLHVKKIYILFGWIMSAIIALALIFGMYHTFHGHPFNKAENIIYGTLSHIAWGFVMGWIVCACWYGYGGYVNSFLSWRGFIPLSRLTYSIYLMHPILDFIIFHSFKMPLYVSDITIVILYTSVLLLSVLASVVLMLLVELPVLNLERCLTGKEKQK